MIDKIYALYWDFLQIPYYKVHVMKENNIVKIFNQKATTKDEGSDFALIDKTNKMCWWINKDYVLKKSRFMFFVNIDNALPLVITEKENTTELFNGLILKEIKTTKMKLDKTKLEKTEKETKKKITGNPSKIVEISLPPTTMYQMIEAHFINKILAKPKSKWEELAPVLIILVIVIGFIAYLFVTSGGKLL